MNRPRGADAMYGKGYDVVKEECFSNLQCVECKGILVLHHRIVKLNGEKDFR